MKNIYRITIFCTRAVCCICIMNFFISSSQAAEINIPADHPTIQGGIDAAGWGDIVRVAAGTYPERIELKPGVAVEGAGAGTTFLDGGGRGPIVWVPNTARANTTSLSGFTIHNGNDGIYRTEEGADSGIYFDWYGSATIEKNEIHSEGWYGIFVSYSPVDSIIRENIIHGNERYGIANYNGEPVIENNIIYGNAWAGIQSWNPSGRPVIRNNTIVSNIGSGWSKGLVFGNGSMPQVFENNIVAHNGGDGIFLYPHDSLPLPLTLYYNCIFGNGTPHNENIVLDPATSVFEDPLFLDVDTHDYTLDTTSPCIDAGNPGTQYNDPDGTRNDMGAYGGTGMSSGDMVPPHVTSHAPAQARDVPRTAPVEISIADAGSGVDINTVTIRINGTLIFDGGSPGTYPSAAWAGDASEYTLTYTPPVPYASGDQITVIVNCRDISSNVMTQYGFSFFVEVYAPVTIRVPEDYTTIQAGIDAARYGDTVKVGTGLFIGNITLKDGVLLHGSGPYFSTILGQGGNGAVTMKEGAVIQNFSIQSGYSAHAVYCWDASPLIRNNLITSNSTSATDNGIFASLWSDPQIVNNTITGFYRGVMISKDDAPLIQNNIIAFCRAVGIHNDDGSGVYPVLEYNDVYGSPADYSGCTPGIGDISSDPLFFDAALQRCTLLPASDCIDAGHPDIENSDVDGSRNDMGAFGGPAQACDGASVLAAFAEGFGKPANENFQGDLDADQDIDGQDLAALSGIFNFTECL